jgi:beta-glucosidase
MSDGPHGFESDECRIDDPGKLPCDLFPNGFMHSIHLGRGIDHKLGEALAEECISLNVDVLLGPGTNMKRSPLCGRNFEYFSEDPFLAGEMAASYIQGIQSRGVGTSLKHFAANNQEYQRFTISSVVDERTLRSFICRF